MSFKSDRLLELVAYGFKAAPTFATTIVKFRSGRTRRNANRSQPLWRFDAPFDRIRSEHYALIESTYISCLGPVHSFRFFNWLDYALEDVVIGTAVGGTDETMQIVKPYSFGGGSPVSKNITKPVDSTIFNIANGYLRNPEPLVITADDVPISFSCDYDSGIVTFTVSGGETIRATGEFDIPVFFEDDDLEFTRENWDSNTATIGLLEDLGA